MNQLESRNKLKAKKPDFNRQNYINGRLNQSWRYPKGIQSKMRRGFRGKSAMPSIGYSSPSSVKGLSSKGLKIKLVNNLKDLEGLNKEFGVVIGSTVGMRSRVVLFTKVKEMGLHVMGMKDVSVYLDNVKKQLEERKKSEKSKKDTREKAKIEAEKKKEETKNKEGKKEEKHEGHENNHEGHEHAVNEEVKAEEKKEEKKAKAKAERAKSEVKSK